MGIDRQRGNPLRSASSHAALWLCIFGDLSLEHLLVVQHELERALHQLKEFLGIAGRNVAKKAVNNAHALCCNSLDALAEVKFG